MAGEVVVACRKSELALVQARQVVSQLTTASSAPTTFTVATKSVVGDADKTTPFLQLSKQTGGSDVGKSLWTNGLEEDLVSGKAHMLVHCLKDMPTTLPPKCQLAAITEREDPSDAVIMKTGSEYKTIDELPPGSVVGSSSSRRRALIRLNWPHLEVDECRGNIDTRLAKLDAPGSRFACILLATAGLVRLNLGHRITQRLDSAVFPYAVGQGALGIEVSEGREDMVQLAVRGVDHKPSRWRCMAERAMLRSLQGGCSSPIGVYTSFELVEGREDSGKLRLHATVADLNGTRGVSADDERIVDSDEGAEELGVSVAKMLVDKGANELLPERG